MIQRIQSVYLLIEFTNLSLISQDGTESYEPWALFAIQMISAIISLVTIFLYKKRMVQIRFTLFNIILAVGYYATLVTFVFMLKGESTFVPSWAVCLPFVGIVLDWLAIRAIGKDEMLVKAYERLR